MVKENEARWIDILLGFIEDNNLINTLIKEININGNDAGLLDFIEFRQKIGETK